jgi:hypothetical protein
MNEPVIIESKASQLPETATSAEATVLNNSESDHCSVTVGHTASGGLVEMIGPRPPRNRRCHPGLRIKEVVGDVVAISVAFSTAQKAGWQQGYGLSFHIDQEEGLLMLRAEPTRKCWWPTIRQHRPGGYFNVTKKMWRAGIRLLLGDAKCRLIPEADFVSVNPDERTIVFRIGTSPA